MHHNGLVASSPLDFGHLFNHINHSVQARAATIRSPVGDVELAHMMIGRLKKENHPFIVISTYEVQADFGVLNVYSPQHKALQPLFPQELHFELPTFLCATAGPVLVAHLLDVEIGTNRHLLPSTG